MKLLTGMLAGAAALLLTTGIAAAATVVADAPLHIRSGPGIEYRVIGVIPDYGAAYSSGCQYGWCRVDYHGRRGWSSSAYLTGTAVAVAPPVYYQPYYAQPYYPGIGVALGPFGFFGLGG
jgi:uncharacterized protein YraI